MVKITARLMGLIAALTLALGRQDTVVTSAAVVDTDTSGIEIDISNASVTVMVDPTLEGGECIFLPLVVG